ncbi:MAG: hypothetical protein ACOX8I_08190, partial [Bacillota bacterium]
NLFLRPVVPSALNLFTLILPYGYDNRINEFPQIVTVFLTIIAHKDRMHQTHQNVPNVSKIP